MHSQSKRYTTIYLLTLGHNKKYIHVGTYYLTVDFCVAMDTNNFILKKINYDFIKNNILFNHHYNSNILRKVDERQ